MTRRCGRQWPEGGSKKLRSEKTSGKFSGPLETSSERRDSRSQPQSTGVPRSADFLKALDMTTAMNRGKISRTFCSCAASNLSLHGRCISRPLQDSTNLVSPYPLNLGGDNFTPKFRGWPPENTVKQGVSDTPPPKFRG